MRERGYLADEILDAIKYLTLPCTDRLRKYGLESCAIYSMVYLKTLFSNSYYAATSERLKNE